MWNHFRAAVPGAALSLAFIMFLICLSVQSGPSVSSSSGWCERTVAAADEGEDEEDEDGDVDDTDEADGSEAGCCCRSCCGSCV